MKPINSPTDKAISHFVHLLHCLLHNSPVTHSHAFSLVSSSSQYQQTMNSKIVPRALVAIPRSPAQSVPPKRLASFSHSFNQSSRFSVSPCLILDPLIISFARQRFVSRAEPDSGAGEVVEAAVEENDEVEEEASEAEVEEEVVKEPRKPIVKLGDVMGILNKRAIEASEKERPIPDLRTGDIVEIKLEVPENRRRLSIYKGIVISKQNAGIHTTIRVRRIIAGVGVEIVFPVYSPNVKEIKVIKHRKVRRARLYYLRDKLPRLSTFK